MKEDRELSRDMHDKQDEQDRRDRIVRLRTQLATGIVEHLDTGCDDVLNMADHINRVHEEYLSER